MSAPEVRSDPKFFVPLVHPVTGKECPPPTNGWSRTPETIQELIAKNEIIFGKDENVQPRRKVFLNAETARQLPSVIGDSGRGKNDLDKLGFDFPYSHPVSLYEEILYASAPGKKDVILDYFAGSGTTGHTVLNLNREDGGHRGYIQIEIGQHFDTVLLPRMKKVAYSPDWKDGKPVSREGVTQLFKYVRLESYEDTMDSLEVAPRTAEQANLLESEPELAEDYRLRYALGAETAGSACLLGKWFSDPFAYTLSVVRDGARREAPVDLPETFNYLIGLDVRSRRRIDGVLVFAGADAERRECAVLWRNLDAMDANALDSWFARNRARLPDSLDVVWVNGDHTLNAMRARGESWSAETIEPAFRELMFDGAD